ncbi:membrane fusion protein (multidrug efflux system) [Roseibium hamelinense]|uniref:Membrane fusion protein (Multidrug efflux system) n=1 Tax=Roseibium hamelinense TaxID=150831 RepID=A0A562SKK5_9HYPH|nr:efflux RND transporter periplasmic adaptor subunit [Roseibium hamelinense]MTI43262.1 efflux RND transporter periplasmic adaptor subunit [Roseibium hamelinense]TWI81809.1 membrane fusion protein (multidrug efflux system) [Roseibium hamelinense]
MNFFSAIRTVAVTTMLALPLSAPATSQEQPPAVLVEQASNMKPGMADVYVGRVEAVNSVDIQARVEGFLETQNFIEGGLVKKGDILFQIEQGLYQATVDQAKAGLEGATATARNAQLALARQKDLLARGDISQATYDAAEATYKSDEAAVGEAQASLETAKINLGYTTITSPINGRISKSAVDVGNLVSTTSGVLATITSIDPVYVSFFISERDLILKRQEGLIGENSSTLNVKLRLSDGASYDANGTIDYISNQVQTATDTVEMRASFANNDGLLVPGQVVTVTFEDPNANEVVVIPQTAIQLDAKGHFVFVVGTDDTVERRDVTLGNQIGRDWVVSSGLKAGDPVVIQGLQKIHEGVKVTPTETQS